MLGGVIASFAGLEGITPRDAAIAATLLVTLSAERAVVTASGIGTFAVRLLDEMAHWQEETLAHLSINVGQEAL